MESFGKTFMGTLGCFVAGVSLCALACVILAILVLISEPPASMLLPF